MDETQEIKQHIQVIAIQMQTLAALDSVKTFLELREKQELLYKSLPKPSGEAEEKQASL